jgi:hypothetical protein
MFHSSRWDSRSLNDAGNVNQFENLKKGREAKAGSGKKEAEGSLKECEP